jgi:hypothetical protein
MMPAVDTSSEPEPGTRVIVHPPDGRAREGTAARMTDDSLWVTFEAGDNLPWDASCMHGASERCWRCSQG